MIIAGQGEMVFKLREGRHRLDVRGKFFTKTVGEVLEQTAQRGCRCPIPGGVQGQVGWGPGQPSLANGEIGGPARQGGWRFMILEVPFNPCHSVIL